MTLCLIIFFFVQLIFIDSRKDVKIHLDNISLRVDEISSKLDVSIANQMKLIAFLLPYEREMIRPPNLPALPLKCINDFWKFEKYLKDAGNMSAMVNCSDIIIYNCYSIAT